MESKELYKEINDIKIDFDKSYQSLTQNRPIQRNTIKKHVEILVNCFNEARILIHGQKEKLNQDHWSQVSKFLIRLRTNLILIKLKFNLDILVPTILNSSQTIETGDEPESTEHTGTDKIKLEDLETNPKIEEQDLNNLTIPAVLMSDLDSSTDSDTSSMITENKLGNNITMAQTNVDFFNTATKLIPVFDGKAENLQSFIDALQILELIKGEHEQFAVYNKIKAKRCRQKFSRK